MERSWVALSEVREGCKTPTVPALSPVPLWPCALQLCPLLADQTEELDSIRRELSEIKARVDSLLESLESMEQQQEQHVRQVLKGMPRSCSPWVPDWGIWGSSVSGFLCLGPPLPVLDFISLGCFHGQKYLCDL